MCRRLPSPEQKVQIYLNCAERNLLLDRIYVRDVYLLRPILDTPAGELVRMTCDELEDLAQYVEAEFCRGALRPGTEELQQLHRKITHLLDACCQVPASPPAATEPVAETSFPVALSPAQRRVAAECVPELVPRLKLDEPSRRVIALTLAELRLLRKQARGNVHSETSGLRRNTLRTLIERVCEAIEEYQGIGRISRGQRLYQLRVSLSGITPPIWRRIQIKDCTLDRLHEHLQLAMGWQNYHLHRFEIDGVEYGDPAALDDGFGRFEGEDATATRLSDIVPKDGRRFSFKYYYDFGDQWEHEVLFEGCLQAAKDQRYPLCLEGERACPPEDIGGVAGYQEYLAALADPGHERHVDSQRRHGPFDPEAFDAAKVTREMRRGMPRPQEDTW